jgi:hypothetical protein
LEARDGKRIGNQGRRRRGRGRPKFVVVLSGDGGCADEGEGGGGGVLPCLAVFGPVHLAYNPSYLVCFFSRNSIFLSQKFSQQCFSAGL